MHNIQGGSITLRGGVQHLGMENNIQENSTTCRRQHLEGKRYIQEGTQNKCCKIANPKAMESMVSEALQSPKSEGAMEMAGDN